MFGFLQPAFRYDASLRREQQNPPANWRREGKTLVFGPEYAANVLDQEQGSIEHGSPADRAQHEEWIMGVSAAQLRKEFPQAIVDAQQFRMSETEKERIRATEWSPKPR